ncbi:MAG: nitroreductase/quinone reductase family protein [Candidatus Dormibacteria bacterium]
MPGIARALNGWMGSSTGPAFVPRAHRWLYAASGGRLGHGIIGVPSLLLHTTGRRSGLRRTTVLVYGRDRDRLVVVASNYGGDHDPAWLGNVRAHPRVEVQVARRRFPAEARVVAPGDADHPRLFALMNRVNRDRYTQYQAGTARPIPLVVLAPGDVPG